MTSSRFLWRVPVATVAALTIWFVGSLPWPRRVDLRRFDGPAVGRLEADMWRSYYERKPALLFWQVARGQRIQYHTGFARSFASAYDAARAAFVFKDGQTRAEYAKALPELERYFASLNAVATERFDPKAAARNELEWWIIRRERDQHTTAEWERLIAEVAAEMYHVPADRLTDYARFRVEAMVLRDQRGAEITEADWRRISSLLEQSWSAASHALVGTDSS
jgi:hypothetical protein